MSTTTDNLTATQPSPQDAAIELHRRYNENRWRRHPGTYPTTPHGWLQYLENYANRLPEAMSHIDEDLFARMSADDLNGFDAQASRTEASILRMTELLQKFLVKLRGQKERLTAFAVDAPSSAKPD